MAIFHFLPSTSFYFMVTKPTAALRNGDVMQKRTIWILLQDLLLGRLSPCWSQRGEDVSLRWGFPCSSPLKNTQQKGQLRTDILWFSYLYHLIWETPAILWAFRLISNMLFLLDHNNPGLLFVFQRPWENLFDSLKFRRESYFILFLIGGWLLYNIVMVSAIHQHESASGIHTFLPS